MNLHKPSPKALIIISFAAVYLGWGTTYLANHFLLEEIPSFIIGCLRFGLAGSLALIWVIIRGQFRLQTSDLISALIGGLMLIAVGQGALIYANQFIATGMVAMLCTALPLWSVLLEWCLGDRPPLKILLGLFIAMLGISLLVGNAFGATTSWEQWFAMALVLGCTFLWAIGGWLLGKRPAFRSNWLGMALQMLVGSLALAILSSLHNDWEKFSWQALSVQSWWWMAYLVLPVSLGVFPAYYWLLRNVRLSTVSTFAFVNPMVALLLGWLVLDEQLSTSTLLACAITLSGVVLLIFGRSRRKPLN